MMSVMGTGWEPGSTSTIYLPSRHCRIQGILMDEGARRLKCHLGYVTKTYFSRRTCNLDLIEWARSDCEREFFSKEGSK